MGIIPSLGQPDYVIIAHDTISATLGLLVALAVPALVSRRLDRHVFANDSAHVLFIVLSLMAVTELYEYLFLPATYFEGTSIATRLGSIGGVLLVCGGIALVAQRYQTNQDPAT